MGRRQLGPSGRHIPFQGSGPARRRRRRDPRARQDRLPATRGSRLGHDAGPALLGPHPT